MLYLEYEFGQRDFGASGSSSERPITSASEGEFTIFLFPDRGVWFAGPAK